MAKNQPTSGADRRAAQREQLRKEREAELKRQRTVRTAVISIVAILGLLITAGIGVLLYKGFKPEEELPLTAPTKISAEKPYLTAGAAPGSGKPEVDIIFDFMCPFCGQFETINGKDINQLITNKDATVNFYVRSFLSEGASTTKYSARAAGAAVAVYEESPEKFVKFQALLFENQPEEGGPGLTDADLVKYAKEAGASEEAVKKIQNHTYQRWAVENLEPAGAKLAPSTPYMRINGKEWGAQGEWQTPGAFAKAVKSAGPAKAGASDAGGASDSGK